MYLTLTIYNLFQCLLFLIVLIVAKKPENKQIIILFAYQIFKDFFFLVSSGYFGSVFAESEFVQTSYSFVAFFKYAVVFNFLYSVLEKPMPKALRLLWLLPVLDLINNLIIKFTGIDIYSYWHVDLSMYAKMLFVYLLLKEIKNFRGKINEISSSKNQYKLIQLYWGKFFIYFNIILSSVLLLYLLFTLPNGKLYTISSPYFVYSTKDYNLIYAFTTSLFLFIFGYLALRNRAIFNTPTTEGIHFEQTLAELVLPEEEKIFQKKIELTEEQKEQNRIVLNRLMETDKVYLDSQLSLNKLSKLSSIPSLQLSQFILATFSKKYKEYVNSYRVVHAQQMLTLKNSFNFTMYSIAFDSGFNSESSFYKIFKEQTGLTPKQYRDKYREALPG